MKSKLRVCVRDERVELFHFDISPVVIFNIVAYSSFVLVVILKRMSIEGTKG